MKWKLIILSILSLLIIIPASLYFCSLDWTKKHETEVANLPLFSKNSIDGKFRLQANGFEYLVRVAGMNNTGQNVVLLHGFPESSIMWESLANRAAKEGFRVLAFDQRGYSPKARPESVEDYHLDKLSEDLFAITDKIGFQNFHLVGHDWGAAVGWKSVMDKPDRILTWTALSIPHIGVFFDGVLNDTNQVKRSSYFNFFKTSYLPEFIFTYAGQRNLKKMMVKLPQNQQNEYYSILAEPGALTATLNWYRAMDVPNFVANKTFEKEISRPTLFIWGANDGVIAQSLPAKQATYIKAPYKEIKLEAGHALIQEKEQEVIQEILTHWRGLKSN
jgi:pimeloyl-ACP methyl ester carboxylesterase